MWSQTSVSENQFYFGKVLLINKTSETIQPALVNPVNDFSAITFEILDLKLIQMVLIIVTLTFACYLLINLTLWAYDYINAKYLNISSTGLTYWNTLAMDKTNIYLHLYDFTSYESINLYLGIIFGNPKK